MALNGNTLGDEILAAVNAATAGGSANRQQLFRAIGNAIVTHIKTNARVSVDATVATGIAVSTTGTAAAQTGQTTATGSATTNDGRIS